jgi:protein SCO1/2
MDTHAAAPLPTDSAPSRVHAWVSAVVSRPWVWGVFVCSAMVIHLVRAMLTPMPPPLPVLSEVPHFQLVDQFGQSFDSNQLRGKLWVANFIFTRCPTVCPALTGQMVKVQNRGKNLGEAWHLVSFSVDPEHDKPEVLDAYAKKFNASPRMWSFLTGEREELRRTIVEGLKVHMTKDGPDDDLMSIGHGSHFVLVDARMRVRGYYDTSRKDGMDRLMRDAGLLANRGE